MFSLAYSLNTVFMWFLVIFVALPLSLFAWLALGTLLAMFLGPLGYIVAFILMLYFWSNY